METIHKKAVDSLPSAPAATSPPAALSEPQSDSCHPLEFICLFAHLQRKELARELHVAATVIRDCLRKNPRSSLRPYEKANRQLIEVFGVRPESTWTERGLPLTMIKTPFDPLWYHAWRSIPDERSRREPIAFSIARRAFLAERMVARYSDYRSGFSMHLSEIVSEIFPDLDSASMRLVEQKVRGQDPVLKLPLSSVFTKFRSELADPSQGEIIRLTRVHNLRALEQFFSDDVAKIEIDHHLF